MIILLLAPLPPPSGGISTWTKNILEYYRCDGRDYEIIHQDTACRLKDVTKVDFFNRWYYGIKEFLRIRYELNKNISLYKPDLIHITSSGSLALLKDFTLLKLAERKKTKVIVHWRFGKIPGIVEKKNWEWYLLSRIIRESSTSIVIDKKSLLSLTDSGHVNVINIPNPIGKVLEDKIHEKAITEYEKLENSILFVGHVVRDKGVFDLVEACTKLKRLKKLTLAGPFEMTIRTELLSHAKRRDQGKWLEITGGIDKEEVLRLMSQHEMLVLPSYSEGFPNVVLEAMSMGCPVIAYEVGAIPEMLAIASDKPCGICVPEKNIQKLGEAIIALLDDPEKAAWLGKNGRARVLEKYSVAQVMKQYESVWRNACSN